MRFNTLRGALVSVFLAALAPATALAAGGEHIYYDRQQWSFAGFTGQYDKEQLQRGFQVYKEVCSNCHGMKRLSFRNLAEPGGPEFQTDALKALAAGWPNKIVDGPNDEGKMFERVPLLSDPILGPFKNEKEARYANNGAYPLDLTLIAKARTIEPTAPWYTHIFLMLKDILSGYQEAGPDYLYALLTGYVDPPKGFQLADGMNYNSHFPGHQIAMVPPLAKDNFIKYQDGTGSLEQNAKDVTAFLAWAADPSLNSRKRIGWQVMLYLLVTTVLLYLAKRRIWARVAH
jgi:cytochrome c1